MIVQYLQPGDVVQLGPNSNFPYCLMVVTEPKKFGAQGYISVPDKLGEEPGLAYYRAKWEDMEFVGKAAWTIGGALPTGEIDEQNKV